MKKLSLALVLLGLSSTAAYAGGIDYQEPEESGVFMIGVEALYAQACDGDFLYAYNETVANGNTVRRQYSPDFDYQWGYHIDIGYAMPGDGPDFTLGWTHLDMDESDSRGAIASSNFSNFGGPDANFGVVGGAPVGNATAKTTYDYTDVDLLIGKEFVLQNRYHFHPFAGVRYGRVDSTDKAAYFLNGAVEGTVNLENEFCGIGPRAGMDAALEISNGFSLVARAAGSLLIGSHSYKYNATNTGTPGTPTSYSFKNNDDTINVPETDYRLGVNYTHEFSPETSFAVELGWNAVHYFDVMDKGTSAINSTAASMGDWGFQGPYLRVQANIA